MKVPGQKFMTETWQLYYVRVGDPSIKLQVYWTETDIKEHDPILNGSNILSGTLRDGIEPWGAPLEMRVPDLSRMGWIAATHKTEGLVWEIYYRLILECDGANIKIKWQIAYPWTAPYKGMFPGDPITLPTMT